MKRIKIVLVLIVAFFGMAGCHDSPRTGKPVLRLEILKEAVEIKYYVELIEKTIAFERYELSSICPHGRKETKIFYDNSSETVYFLPKDSIYLYYLARYPNYERYATSRIDSVKDITKILSASSCNLVGKAIIDYDVEMTDPLPELHEEDYELISELIVYVKNEFAKRQEHFRYDVYIGDFIRGEMDGKGCAMIALAVTGESDYYIVAELTEKENGYDIWLFPSPFGLPDPTILDTRPFYESEIEKIVRFGMPFGFIDEN